MYDLNNVPATVRMTNVDHTHKLTAVQKDADYWSNLDIGRGEARGKRIKKERVRDLKVHLEEILAMKKEGKTNSTIARRFGVTPVAISYWVHKEK